MRFPPRLTLRDFRIDREIGRATITPIVVGWIAAFALGLGAIEPLLGASVLTACLLAVLALRATTTSEDREVRRAGDEEPGPQGTTEAEARREDQLTRLATELPSCKDLQILLEEAAARLASIFDANWVEILTPEGREGAFESETSREAGIAISVPIPSADGVGQLALETCVAGPPATRLHADLRRAALLVADAVERHEIRRMLREAERQVEETNSAKRDFLANTSHEIRTPLHGILGSAHLLAGTELDRTQREFVETITRCSDALLAVMSDVLELATLESGSVTINERPFDMRECIEAVARFARSRAPEAVDVVVECSAGLDHDLIGAGPQIQRALTHFASNAVKFTETGRVIVSAHKLSRGRPTNGRMRVRFAVEDTGLGIPPERRNAIFERFSQADGGSTRMHSGAGLGLSIADELVTLMGSTIELESQIGVGSTFAFVLELEEAFEAPARAVVKAVNRDEARGEKRVLVVDDNPVNLRIAQRILEHKGLSVEVAKNGLEAVELAVDGSFDLILMDLQMPAMDGFEATKALLKRWQVEQRPGAPIVALTAHAMDEHRRRCLEAGMVGFLTKPLQSEELDDVLARLVDVDRAVA